MHLKQNSTEPNLDHTLQFVKVTKNSDGYSVFRFVKKRSIEIFLKSIKCYVRREDF
jgi:hypothetical protein